VIVVLGMEVMEVGDAHVSCIVGEMGNWRAGKKPGERCITTGMKCWYRYESPLGFHGPVLDLEEEIELRAMLFPDSALIVESRGRAGASKRQRTD